MAYNLKLAERIRSELEGLPFVERKMFGGVRFLLNGNMACGVNKNDVIVRVDPEKHSAVLKRPHAKPFDMTGRPMKGRLVVEADGCKTDKQLGAWVTEGVDFAMMLPAKRSRIKFAGQRCYRFDNPKRL
ncbi:MAG TPA: TfoX/Sxy family protein [Anaerolineales bacterium]|nr:TfoX/Sxy family protein [Anaerolineales bacterium]